MSSTLSSPALRRPVHAMAWILLALLAAVLPAAAQVNLATLEVFVAGGDGAPLPGVTVEVARPDTGLSRVLGTGASGTAVASALPPGTYRVRIALEGFQPLERDGIVLRVGQTARVEVTLQMQASEEITVTGSAELVDVLKTDSSTNIVPEQIDTLPVADRDFQRLAFIAPGVQRERGDFRFIGGGPVIGAGGNASNATILVDGVDLTDPALGLARVRFSQDAIQEFRVINNRFDSEIGGSAGGALSIITRSGTNELAGRVFAFYRADELREPGALEQDNTNFSRGQYGFTVGGPITRDRTHYFLAFEYIDEQNVSLFRPGGAFGALAEDVDHPFQQSLVDVSLDHQLGDRQSLSGKLVYEDYSEENFRVGGVVDEAAGQELNRKNWNVSLEHVALLGGSKLNELRFQAGQRKYTEPTNSNAVSEWFSGGATLQTGSNILGDLLGDGELYEIRDTFHLVRDLHELKLGGAVQSVEERSRIDTFQEGLFIYAFDNRVLPIVFLFGEGSSDVTTDTTRIAAFVQDDWRPSPNLTVNLGLRYDLDLDGNNPDFRHPLVPDGRDRDSNNFQPRFGFSWDAGGDGRHVLRGGAGLFTGRYLLVPSLIELQQNGITGRVTRQRLNGAILGLPPIFWLDPDNPFNTGIPLPPDISLLDSQLDAPEAVQVTLGWTARLGASGLFFDTEAVYVDGDDEIVIRDVNFGGNANPVRSNPTYNQINTYTNQGRSKYKALVFSLNGTLDDKHLITASLTVADKKNIADDFSPVFPFGYPSDPADIDAEYGRSRADEPWRFVASAILRLPKKLTLAPIYEYGAGQPWNHRLGFDFNGDGKNSDRPEGVARNSQDGPPFRQLSLRLSRPFQLGGGSQLEAIVEAFNVFDTTNFDVRSIDTAEFLSGPTLANPALPLIPNPTFGEARATFPGREIQVGLRWLF